MAGLLADSRAVVQTAREEASNHRFNYGASVPLKVGIVGHVFYVYAECQCSIQKSKWEGLLDCN